MTLLLMSLQGDKGEDDNDEIALCAACTEVYQTCCLQ